MMVSQLVMLYQLPRARAVAPALAFIDALTT